MATYTYVTDATEDAALRHMLKRSNAVREQQGLAPLTDKEFMAQQVQGVLASFDARKAVDAEEEVLSAYASADPEKQAQIRQSLAL